MGMKRRRHLRRVPFHLVNLSLATLIRHLVLVPTTVGTVLTMLPLRPPFMNPFGELVCCCWCYRFLVEEDLECRDCFDGSLGIIFSSEVGLANVDIQGLRACFGCGYRNFGLYWSGLLIDFQTRVPYLRPHQTGLCFSSSVFLLFVCGFSLQVTRLVLQYFFLLALWWAPTVVASIQVNLLRREEIGRKEEGLKDYIFGRTICCRSYFNRRKLKLFGRPLFNTFHNMISLFGLLQRKVWKEG
ncbi:hypothetical protein NE237_011740 [Protea cynaroides]|uniref:Uncharacterized protein n=1 Tax=Protea cynaroides TaxID=273540 RepID=A0A9Q0GZQ6_9MAGN|nr:hypothetical protein NE237_011740 [Protea cynaroides]